MEKTTKKRVRNVVLGVTSAALVAGITSALTLAIMSDNDVAVNTFTADPALTTQIAEPAWDGLKFGEDGNPINQNDKDLGYNQAKVYTPNVEIPKNPQMKNNSESDEYVAIRLVYQVQCVDNRWHTISPNMFKENFAVLETNDDKHNGDDTDDNNNYNTADWDMETVRQTSTTVDDAEVYYYKDSSGLQVLGTGQETSSVFDFVKPCKSLTNYTKDETGDKWMFNISGDDVKEQDGKKQVTNITDFYPVATGHATQTLTDIQGKEVRILIGNSGYPRFRILVQGAAVQAKAGTITDDEAKTTLKGCFPEIKTDYTN